MGKRPKRASHNSFRREIISALTASAICVASLDVIRLYWPHHAPEMQWSELSRSLYFFYGALLFCSWLLSEDLIPLVHEPRLALVVGTGDRALKLMADLQSGHKFRVVGCIDDSYLGTDPVADRYLGDINLLEGLLKESPVEAVLIALPVGSMYNTIQRVIRICETVGVDASYMTDLFETTIALRSEQDEAQHGRLTVITAYRPDFRLWIKYAFDFFFALVLLCLFSPLLLLIAIAVRVSSPGPIFFSGERYGMHRRRFAMYKFRTMVVDAETQQVALEALNEAQGPVFKIKEDPRVTRIGRFLRKMSLDELPQLWNVLRGEMSLVGPRPLPLRDVGRFEESWLLRRFSVKPGLTCLWQIRGRSNTTFEEWIRQDLEYIDGWSLSLDAKILLMTLPAVLRGRGAS